MVDLDGTLTPTDTLLESLLKLLKTSPIALLNLPLWLLHGRARFKASVTSRVSLSVEHLPLHGKLLAYLREQKTLGRSIVLATAAHVGIARAIGQHVGIFDKVIATAGDDNLKGEAKLRAIREAVGNEFVYAGDSRADVPIWEAAKAAILVGVPSRLTRRIRRSVVVEREFPRRSVDLGAWARAFRVHQWVKNCLLFVPALTAFSLSTSMLSQSIVAFVAFSLAASATYIVNDLLDLEADRAHPRKRTRPFASAHLPIAHGLVVALVTLVIGCLLALAVSAAFFVMLLIYLGLTSAYSWTLKQYVVLDVLVLAILYTLRIFAGSVAIGVTTSSWLLAFSIFLFLSLALVKRCAELVTLHEQGTSTTRGRDYRVTDLAVLWPLGVAAAVSAIVVFGLFIVTPETQARYASPQLLWLVGLGLIYWLTRLWIKTSRGEMHDDPIVYAAKDHGSRILVLVIIAVVVVAHTVAFSWPL